MEDLENKTGLADEYYFPDFSMDEVVPIKDVNPVDLQNFKGKFVKIEGWNAVYYFGRIYTIDPVSLCVVIGRRRAPNDSIEVEIIMGHIVKMLKVSEEHPWSAFIAEKELDSIFTSDIIKDNKPVEATTPSQCEVVPSYTKEMLAQKRETVKSWLKKNLLPVSEHGESLVVAGGVTINPPYNKASISCSSGNEIIQNKIGKMLSLIPGIE